MKSVVNANLTVVFGENSPLCFVIDPRVWQHKAYQIIFLNQIHSYDIETR